MRNNGGEEETQTHHLAILSRASPGESSSDWPSLENLPGPWAMHKRQCPPDTRRTRKGKGILKGREGGKERKIEGGRDSEGGRDGLKADSHYKLNVT